MRTRNLLAASAALMMAAMIVAIALVAINAGTKPKAKAATTAARPAPTVTVTQPQPPPSTVVVPPSQPQVGSADETFLEMIAADGIKAPADWAIKAGRETCGKSYNYAYRYLTEGGIYSYHVQTFLDDWLIAHGGC